MARPPINFDQQSALYAQPVHQQADYATDPMAATRQAMGSEFLPRDAVLGAQAREIAELKYGDDFRRWGPEIDLALNQIAPHQRTPAVVDWIVRGVRGTHADELSAEYAERRIKQLVEGGTLRPQTGDTTGDTLSSRVDLDKLPPNYSQRLKQLGVTSGDIDRMLTKVYPDLPLTKAREKWTASAAKGDVFSDGERGWAWKGNA